MIFKTKNKHGEIMFKKKKFQNLAHAQQRNGAERVPGADHTATRDVTEKSSR